MKREFSIKKLIITAITLLTFLAVLYGLNGLVLAPVPQLRLNTPSAVTATDTGLVIADRDNSRLIFTDAELSVRRVSNVGFRGSPIDVVNAIDTDGSNIYITGAKLIMLGSYYSSESLVMYSPAGEYVGELYRIDYGEDDYVTGPCILDLEVSDDGSVLIAVRTGESSLELVELSGGEAHVLRSIDTGYGYEKAMLTENGSGLVWQSKYRMSSFGPDGTAESVPYETALAEIRARFGVEDTPALTIGMPGYLPLLSTMSETSLFCGGEQRFFYTADDGMFSYSYESGENGLVESLSLSPQLFMQYLVFWLSALWLAVLLVIFLVKLLRKIDRKALATVLLIIFIASGISFFYTYRSYRQLEEEYGNRLSAQLGQIEATILSQNYDIIEETSINGMDGFCSRPENLDRIAEMEDTLIDFVNANGREDSFNAGADIIYADKLWGLISSDYSGQAGNDLFDVSYALQYYPSLLTGGSGGVMFDGISYFIASDTLPNSRGDGALMLYVGFSINHLKTMQRQNGIDMFITLLVLMIAVYTCHSTFRKLSGTITEYRERRLLGGSVPRLPLFCGAAAFICTVICQFDSVVLVFAAQSLSEGLSPLEAAKYAALPISLYSFGLMGGSTVAGFAERKLGGRGATLLSCIVGTLALICAVAALNTGSLPLFTAAKLVEGLTVAGIAYSIIYSAPYGLADKDEQRRVYTDCQTASASAGLLGVLAGGYISEYLSYSAIFAVKAALTAALGAICFVMFGRGEGAASAESAGERQKGTWGFYIRPKVLLMYLGGVLPLIIFGCYRSYLFPIYSRNAGISTVMLSNISIISRFLASAATGAIAAVSSRYSSKKVFAGSLIIMAACFMLFTVSPNIWWAIAVLFITNVLTRSGNLTSSFYTAELCEELGYDVKSVQLKSDSIRGIFNTAGTPILALFLALGDDMACAAVGAACMALIAVFLLFSRKKKAEALPA